jgi:serine phosphatase RsbU (regulator of sigma subunit)
MSTCPPDGLAPAGAAQAVEAAVPSIDDLLAATRRRAELSARLNAELAGSLNVRRIVMRLLNLLVPERGNGFADWAMVAMADEVKGVVQLHGGLEPGPVTNVALDPHLHPALGRVMLSGHTETLQVSPDPRIDDGVDTLIPDAELCEQARALRPAEVLACPLSARGHSVGALLLVRGDSGGFPQEDIDFAEQVAARFALALDSARLYEDRARVAAAVERSLRPAALPMMPHVRFAATFRPAAEHLQIGGDFYDVHASEEDCVAVLGDVCGKGIDAAVLTGRARQSIRTAVLFDRQPGRVLSTLNTVLYEQGSDRFVTAVCARVRPRATGGLSVDLAVAGHPPPLVLRADGTIEEVQVWGRLAGVLADLDYDEVTVELAAGDTLLLFSDGIFEARGRDDVYGMGRLAGVMRAYAGAGPDALCEAIEQDVVEFLAGHAHDDMTMLAMSPRS